MTIINIPPTRSNLLQMKNKLEFTRDGYNILEKKREILTTELLQIADQADALQNEVWELITFAYQALEKARLTMGQEHVEWAALAVTKSVDVIIRIRSTMGVSLPRIEARGEPPELSYSLGSTTVELDESNAAFRHVLEKTPQLTELVSSVWRLAHELKQTQRRVKALERIFIPNYEETIRFIEDTLEEHEREETFRLKWLKSKREAEEIQPIRSVQ